MIHATKLLLRMCLLNIINQILQLTKSIKIYSVIASCLLPPIHQITSLQNGPDKCITENGSSIPCSDNKQKTFSNKYDSNQQNKTNFNIRSFETGEIPLLSEYSASHVCDLAYSMCHGKHKLVLRKFTSTEIVKKRILFSYPFCSRLSPSAEGSPSQRVVGASVVLVSVLVLIASFASRTWIRNRDWTSDETLYSSGTGHSSAKALCNLGVVAAAAGHLQEAERLYRAALLRAPHVAETHFNLGLLLASVKKYELAIVSYRNAIARRPWFAQAMLSLARAYLKLHRDGEADETLRLCSAASQAPAKDGNGHMTAVTACRERLAQRYLHQNNFRAAQSLLKQAHAEAPPYYPLAPLLTRSAEVLLARRRHLDARALLRRALGADPTYGPAHVALARTYVVQGNCEDFEVCQENYAVAEDLLRGALASATEDAPLLLRHLGQLLLEQKKVSEAAVVWEHCSLQDPADHTTAFNTATAFRLAGDLPAAEHHYRRALLLHPQDAATERNLGAILHLTGRLAEARQHYLKALSLMPGHPNTLINLRRLDKIINRKVRNR